MTVWIIASVALLALHISLQAISATLELGSHWNAGPRDGAEQPRGRIAGRSERALRNYLETFPAFGILAVALVASGRADGVGLLGAQVWVAARIVYIPLYLAGIPYLRTLVWIGAALGLVAMCWRLIA